VAEAYAKAFFERLDAGGNPVERLPVQFNPTELSMTKGAQIAEIAIPGLDSPVLQFVRGQNEQVTLELFFDSTESGTGAGAVPVTDLTNRFYSLVKMTGREHAPPRCRFVWGAEFPGLVTNERENVSAKRNAFDCIVESIQQKFTLFSPDGVPLRATLSVGLREYKTLRTQLEQLNLQSTDHTRVHTVQRGETLPAIAFRSYGDPARWRLIAEANRLLRPRDIAAGQVLELPPLPA
jgi:nucleoid-associated protein YgaU